MNIANYLSNCLFRYRKLEGEQVEKNIDALKANRLYFSKPQYFNDPYDNLMFVNINQMIQEMRVNLGLFMPSYVEGLKKRDLLMGSYSDFLWNSNKKDRFIQEYEGAVVQSINKIKEQTKNNLKIICFSENALSMLMWSHYAGNHQGFIVAYDREIIKCAKIYDEHKMELTEKAVIAPVKYKNKRVDMTEAIHKHINKHIFPGELDVRNIPELPQKTLKEFVTTKSLEWEYEKEIRMVPRIIDITNESPFNYIECIPKAIILGSCCKEKYKNELAHIANKKGVSIFQACIEDSKNQYELKLREI